jgi:hypothetical protein
MIRSEQAAMHRAALVGALIVGGILSFMSKQVAPSL